MILKKGKSQESYNIGGNNEWSNIKLVKKFVKFLIESIQIMIIIN